ncbi:MAG: hypothetical protein ACPGSB_01155 [Opitutales bacterium]
MATIQVMESNLKAGGEEAEAIGEKLLARMGDVSEYMKALKVLDNEDALLPKATVLRCRVRYFTDGAILGSKEFVRAYVEAWQLEKKRKFPPPAQSTTRSRLGRTRRNQRAEETAFRLA